MQLENLREFAARHRVPVNPDQPRQGGEGSGIAQTFASQVALTRCLPTPCKSHVSRPTLCVHQRRTVKQASSSHKPA